MGFLVGRFILGAIHNAILLIVVVIIFGVVAALFTWNSCWSRRAMVSFISQYPDTKFRTAKDGQYVEVSRVVTCGNVPLESSYQKIPRCVYTSTSLYEYRGCDSKAANCQHRRFTWGLRSVEVPLYVATKMASIRRSSFFVPSVDTYAKAALRWIGYEPRCTPYWPHSVIWCLLSMVSESTIDNWRLGFCLNIRKRGQLKDSQKKDQ